MTKTLSPEHRAALLAGRLAAPKESADDYPFVVIPPTPADPKTRVIRCKDNLQFILQRRSGAKWVGVWLFATVLGARRIHGDIGLRAVALFGEVRP